MSCAASTPSRQPDGSIQRRARFGSSERLHFSSEFFVWIFCSNFSFEFFVGESSGCAIHGVVLEEATVAMFWTWEELLYNLGIFAPPILLHLRRTNFVVSAVLYCILPVDKHLLPMKALPKIAAGRLSSKIFMGHFPGSASDVRLSATVKMDGGRLTWEP